MIDLCPKFAHPTRWRCQRPNLVRTFRPLNDQKEFWKFIYLSFTVIEKTTCPWYEKELNNKRSRAKS